MSDPEQTDPLYKDAMKEYGMKGTVIPPATSRAQSKSEEGVPSEDIGTRFDLHKPVPHNIVEILPDGSQKITKLDAPALARLQQANRRVNGAQAQSKPIGYAEAVSGQVKRAEAQADGFVPIRHSGVVSTGAGIAAVGPSGFIPAAPSRKRTLVRFEGSFGRLSVPYDHVYQDTQRPDLLIMVQYNPDCNHFEAPESNDYILVMIGEYQFMCLSGVQFSSEDRKTHYTVFAIDFSRMQQSFAVQEVSNGSKEG